MSTDEEGQADPASPLTREQAEAIAAAYLAERNVALPVRIAYEPLESPSFWVFFYQSVAYLHDDDFGSMLLGNGPVVVPKDGSPIIRFGTAKPTEDYLAELDPQYAEELELADLGAFDLDGWAAKARMTPTALASGDLLGYTDNDLCIFLADREGLFVVEKTERGGRRQLLGAFGSRVDATKWVVYWIGSGIPSARPAPADRDCQGAELDYGPTGTVLRWKDGSAEFSIGVRGKLAAAEFNWARVRSVDEIASRFDPTWLVRQ